MKGIFKKYISYYSIDKQTRLVNRIISISTITTFFYIYKSNILDSKYALNILDQKLIKRQYLSIITDTQRNLLFTLFSYTISFPIRRFLAKSIINKFNSNNKNNKKSLIQRFGLIGFSIYMSYWVVTGIIIYYLVSYKYIDTNKFLKLIEGSYIENYYRRIEKKYGEGKTDFVVAYVINACLEIVRLPTFIFFFKLFSRKK